MKHNHKYFIYSAVLVLLASSQVFAQSGSAWLGARAGVNIGNLTDNNIPTGESLSSKTGFDVGGEFDYWFSDNLGLCAQLMYIQKGGTINVSDGLITGTDGLTVSSLEIPVLLKATFGSGPLKPVIFAGPAIGLKLSASEHQTAAGHDSTASVADSLLTSTYFSIVIGVGVTYALSSAMQIFLDAAYDLGLSNINAQFGKDEGGGQTNNIKITLNDIRINVGIIFRLGD
jgi:hypothetical protein